jgi:glycopeptide antibiotics resistance protein
MQFIDGEFAVLPAIPVAIWIWRQRRDREWRLLALVALAHAAVVVGMTVFPIPYSGQDFYRQTRGLSGDNVVPFATIRGQLDGLTLNTVRQLSGNVLLLAPLGVYGPALWPALREWRRFAAAALAVGVAIEMAQLAGSVLEGFSYRITDIDDAMLNAAGAVVAFMAWGLIVKRWPRVAPTWLRAEPPLPAL